MLFGAGKVAPPAGPEGALAAPTRERTAGGSSTVQERAPTFPYVRKPRLLSASEASFFAALRSATAGEYDVFSKVRLIDVCDVKRGSGFQAAFNRVVAKQMDFLLCDPVTSQPLLAIELDDRSHSRPDRVARDAFIEEVFEVIGLPVLWVKVTAAFDREHVRQQIAVAARAERE